MAPGEKLSQLADDVEYYNGIFLNKRSLNIYCYYWKPRVEPRALLLICHGYTEHCMMYVDLAKEMSKRGFFVFAHDQAGHGHSEGDRGFVVNVHDLVEDSVTHIQMMKQDYRDLPVFICGHSMGGEIAVMTAVEKAVKVNGIALIAPALAPNPETATPFKLLFAKLINKFLPRFPIVATDFHLSCQNEEKVQEMYNDPLRYKGWWKVGPILTLIDGAEEIHRRINEVKVPFLLLHGDNDKVCHIGGSASFYEKAPSSDKTFKVYPGGYHSLLNEPDEIANDVFDRIVKWIESRVPIRSSLGENNDLEGVRNR